MRKVIRPAFVERLVEDFKLGVTTLS